jgi:8-oxo-dGTP pyrophosphatase MutT (NUDIX family)
MNIHQNRTQHCTNCGQSGHIFRNCLSPVTSYGIIAVRFPDHLHSSSLFSKSFMIHNQNQSIQFLLIQRKDSISFIEFIRGKYNYNDEEYICKLLRNMTQNEQQRLLTKTFDELWFDIWGESSNLKTHKNNYDISEKRFLQLLPKLSNLIQSNPSKWTEPEWGFPKGRRNPYETDMNCAIREFQEETGLKRSDFSIIQNTHAISETFFGSNHVHYCHKYYLAICHPHIHVQLNVNNPLMLREIGDIKWFSLEDAISKIRPDNVEKREILLKAGKIMKNFYPIYTNDSSRNTYYS